jgi:hypothetical protein
MVRRRRRSTPARAPLVVQARPRGVRQAQRGAAWSMTRKIPCDEVAAFSPSADPEPSSICILVVFIGEDTEAENVLDAAVEVEQRRGDRDEYEHWEEVIEPCAQRRQVDQSAEEVVERRPLADMLREEGQEVIRERDGQLGDLTSVPARRLGVGVASDESAAIPDRDRWDGRQGAEGHVADPESGYQLAAKTNLVVFVGWMVDNSQ